LLVFVSFVKNSEHCLYVTYLKSRDGTVMNKIVLSELFIYFFSVITEC